MRVRRVPRRSAFRLAAGTFSQSKVTTSQARARRARSLRSVNSPVRSGAT